MTWKDHLVRQIQEHGDNLEDKERLMKELEKNNETFAKLIMTLKEANANLDNEYLSKAMDSRF